VSLLLFGEVHKEHWKTEPGTVIGLLNPNPMKQKDGYDGVSDALHSVSCPYSTEVSSGYSTVSHHLNVVADILPYIQIRDIRKVKIRDVHFHFFF